MFPEMTFLAFLLFCFFFFIVYALILELVVIHIATAVWFVWGVIQDGMGEQPLNGRGQSIYNDGITKAFIKTT